MFVYVLFSVFHLGDVEKSFTTLTFSSCIFMFSTSAWAERSPRLGSGGQCLPGRYVGVGGCMEIKEAGQDLRAHLGIERTCVT